MKTDLATRPGRPFRTLALALLALAAGAILAASGNDAGAASGTELGYQQNVKHAIFGVKGVDELAVGSRFNKICWTLEGRKGTPDRRWCAERSGSKWKLSGKRTGLSVKIDGKNGKLVVNPQTAPLPAGLYRWHIFLGDCTGATAPTGATGPTAPTEQCDVTYPRSGGGLIRVKPLVATGCRVKGPSQVNDGPRRGKKIALTFDDGPAPITPRFLNELKSLNIPATFFMLGQQVNGNKGTVRRMLREGHELANHSWNHANLGGGGGGASAQIRNTNNVIKRVSGFKPCVFRPPYGSTGGDLVSRVRAQKMTSILWDVDPLDWRLPGTGRIVSIIRGQTHAGSIILEHDGGGPRGQTLAAIPQYVRTLKSRGYKFVTVSELLGYKTTYKLGG